MLSQLLSILAFAALSVAAFGLGRPVLRWIGVAKESRLATVALSVGLGLTVAGLTLLLLALAGLFHQLAIVVLTMIYGCWGLVEIGVLWVGLEEPDDTPLSEPCSTPPDWPTPHRWVRRSVLAAAAIVCLASLLTALTPPTTTTTVTAHLESAKRLLVEGCIAAPATSQDAPQLRLVEAWSAWALTLDGAVCAQLLHWGLGILLAMSTAILATPLLGRPWAWMAAALVLLTPAINRQMGVSSESVAIAAFCTLGLAAWCQAVLHGGERGWFIVAGITAGAALGIHITACLLAVPLTIVWGFSARRHLEHRRFLLQGGAIAALTALGIGVACHLPTVWVAQPSHGLFRAATSGIAWPESIGVLLLAAAPSVFLVRRLRGLRILLWTAGACVALTVLLGNDPRLLFPAVPLISVAAVWGWMELPRFSQNVQRFAAAALALALACNLTLSLAQSPKSIAVALGLEDREAYLLQHDPTYRAAMMANRILRGDTHILSQDPQAFYFDCHVTRAGEGLSVSSAPETVHHLRNAGFTHLLLTDGPAATGSKLHQVAETIHPLDDYSFRTTDGSVRRYRLVSLR